jgi:hypothetical protein
VIHYQYQINGAKNRLHQSSNKVTVIVANILHLHNIDESSFSVIVLLYMALLLYQTQIFLLIVECSRFCISRINVLYLLSLGGILEAIYIIHKSYNFFFANLFTSKWQFCSIWADCDYIFVTFLILCSLRKSASYFRLFTRRNEYTTWLITWWKFQIISLFWISVQFR